MIPATSSLPPANPAHVELRDVTVGRENRAFVSGLDLAIPRGVFVAVVGPSGVGKTSLLACLGGLLQPKKGHIAFRCERQCLHSPANYQQRLGLVFQHLRLTPNATVLTNVLCGLLGQRSWWQTLWGFGKKDRVQALAMLRRFGLEPYAHLPASQISGGERQRVAIARALMASPELVLADEPVASLDPKLARQVLADLKNETRENHRTVFCVLHDENYVNEFADYTLTLSLNQPTAWQLTRRAA